MDPNLNDGMVSVPNACTGLEPWRLLLARLLLLQLLQDLVSGGGAGGSAQHNGDRATPASAGGSGTPAGQPPADEDLHAGGLAAVLEQPQQFVPRLLHPFDLPSFYAEVWGRRPHHFSRSESWPQHNADLVPSHSPGAVQGFIRACVSAVGATRGGYLQERRDITLVKRGAAPVDALVRAGGDNPPAPSVSPAMVTAALKAGYSAVVNWMQWRSSPVICSDPRSRNHLNSLRVAAHQRFFVTHSIVRRVCNSLMRIVDVTAGGAARRGI